MAYSLSSSAFFVARFRAGFFSSVSVSAEALGAAAFRVRGFGAAFFAVVVFAFAAGAFRVRFAVQDDQDDQVQSPRES